jgi:hypothetical protein
VRAAVLRAEAFLLRVMRRTMAGGGVGMSRVVESRGRSTKKRERKGSSGSLSKFACVFAVLEEKSATPLSGEPADLSALALNDAPPTFPASLPSFPSSPANSKDRSMLFDERGSGRPCVAVDESLGKTSCLLRIVRAAEGGRKRETARESRKGKGEESETFLSSLARQGIALFSSPFECPLQRYEQNSRRADQYELTMRA